jgi:hypothetical protein
VKPCTVEPHPTKPGAYVVRDPRVTSGVVVTFTNRERAAAFAATRNRYRAAAR